MLNWLFIVLFLHLLNMSMTPLAPILLWDSQVHCGVTTIYQLHIQCVTWLHGCWVHICIKNLKSILTFPWCEIYSNLVFNYAYNHSYTSYDSSWFFLKLHHPYFIFILFTILMWHLVFWFCPLLIGMVWSHRPGA